MLKIPENIEHFLESQGCVVFSTIDEKGFPHSSCKDIIKIDKGGRIYLLDVYHGRTLNNLITNPLASVTAFNEHKFSGFCLKGTATVLAKDNLTPEIIKAWEDRISSRLTKRLLKNIQENKGHASHPEASLPGPKYLVMLEVNEIVDLTPHNLR